MHLENKRNRKEVSAIRKGNATFKIREYYNEA